MANPAWTDVVTLKGAFYLALDSQKPSYSEFDTDLQGLIEAVTAEMVNYIDDADRFPSDTGGTPGPDLKRACAEQCTYEWKRRNDRGLSSVSFANGSVNKYQVEEWLTKVEKILNRYKRYHIAS